MYQLTAYIFIVSLSMSCGENAQKSSVRTSSTSIDYERDSLPDGKVYNIIAEIDETNETPPIANIDLPTSNVVPGLGSIDVAALCGNQKKQVLKQTMLVPKVEGCKFNEGRNGAKKWLFQGATKQKLESNYLQMQLSVM